MGLRYDSTGVQIPHSRVRERVQVLSEATVERSEAVQAGNGAPKGPPSHTTEVPHLDEVCSSLANSHK